MKMRFGLSALAAVGIAAMTLAGPAAQAGPVYSFESDEANGGSISWDGNAGSGVVGSSLPIEVIQFNNGALASCTGCVLDFTTGAFSQAIGATTLFDGGGTFTISGDFGAGFEVLAQGVVGESNWMNSPVGLDGTFSLLETAIVSSTVQSFFGESPILDPIFGGFAAVSFATTGSGPGFQSATNGIAAVDVHLTPVPEPATLGLLGAGLLGLGLYRRRRA